MPEKEPQFLREERSIKGEQQPALTPENRELIEDVIEHPLTQKILAGYQIFCDYYFDNKLELRKEEFKARGVELPTKEEIKERAEQVFFEDFFRALYEDILKLAGRGGRVLHRDIKEIFVRHFAEELGEDALSQLRKARKGIGEKKFNETIKNILINKSAEKMGGIPVGRFFVTIDGENKERCNFHLPPFAENWGEVLQERAMAHKLLAEKHLLKDKRFQNVKTLEGISWIYGDEKKAKSFDELFGWNRYTDKDIELLLGGRDSGAYRHGQFMGIRYSPKLFEGYILEGKMPKIGGRWITKEEFMEKMLPYFKSGEAHASEHGPEMKEKEPQEIERKFYIEAPPKNFKRHLKKEIIQGYLEIKDDFEARIRKETQKIKGKEVNKYYRTEKQGSGKIRKEISTSITKEEFEALWPKTEGQRTQKMRYKIRHRGHNIELDVFQGELSGLKTAEVEFDSKEKSEKFKPPKWFGKELTDDERFKNKNLARYGLPAEIRENPPA